MKSDPVIRRSRIQVTKRIETMRAELIGYGFSIVRTEFLQSLMDRADEKTNSAARDRIPPKADDAG